MSHQPWLEDLPDDWVSTPGTPTSPSPPQAINDSRPSTGQNSPSRIPVPARRPAQQSPASEGKKKITRPCHFIKREPPTPKSPRSPNTPSKLRSPVPSKSKKSPKPSPAAARKQQPPVDTRSPLRSVSNVSSQSAPQNTVQVRPKQGREDETTPEYRKRLVHGGIPASEQRDLFAPIGLESVFNPPSPGLETAQHEQIPMGKNQDDTVSAEEGPGESYDWNEGDPTAGLGDGDPIKKHLEVNHDSYRKNTTISWDLPNPSLEVREKANQSRSRDVSHNNTFQRTASGLEDLRNEGITPITFSRSGTVHGNSTSEVIQSALKQVTDKLGHLSLSPGCRPDSRASDSMLFHQHSEHPDDVFSEDDLLDTTSQSLPQDLSMGTQESAVRRAFSNYRREQHLGDGFFHSEHPTPSPFPSQRRPRSALANSRIQSSPSFLEKERPTDPPTLPRSPSHVRTSVTQDSEDLDTNAMPSSGSPLKLFGNHDTFTNNKLLRRMSQFEETFGDLSEDEEPVSPSEEARRKGEIRGFLNVQQGTPRGPSMRRNERSRSRNGMHLRMSRFGNGQLDNFDFSDTSPYEPKLPYDEPTNHDIRLPLRSRSADGRRYHSQSSYRDFSPGSRSTYSNVRRNASSGDYRPASSDAVFASRLGVDGEDDLNITGKERSSNTRGKSPTPKRRKTILRPIGVDKENQAFEGSATQFSESMSLLKKSLIQHGVDYDDEMALRPPSTQRPRNPTPAQARSTPGKGDSPSRNRPKPDSNDWGAPGSLSERPLPMVKVTDANDERRKGSITTQDFLSEATKIMDIIRAKGKNGGGLPDVEEFDIDHEHNDGDYEDESTLDDFVRPPSREGVDVRKLRAQKEPDPRVLSHLRKFQENEDLEFGVSASFSFDKVRNTASGGETGGGLGGIPNDHQLQEDAMDARKRKYSAPFSNDDDSRNLSARSIPTGSSQSSHAKGVLSSDLVSHLIPEQVNGLTYDRLKHQWVKERARRSRQSLGTPRTDDSEEDPFRDIPDLSVDELQEMMGIQPYSPEKTKDLTAAEAEDSYESPISPRTSRKPELQPQAKDGEHSADASTVQSKATRYTSSIPNSGTRATSWDTDPSKRKDSTSEVEHEIQLHEGRFSRPPKSDDSNHQARVVTISFSSPLVSHVAYSDDPSPARSGVQTRSPHGRNKKPQRLGDGSYRSPNRSPVFPPRRTPIKGQQFIRRPVSRIDERNEDTMEDLSLARQNSTFPNECTENNDRTEASLVRSVERRMSYSFHLSPLPDFTVDQIDQSLHLEMSYVAERTHPSSLRQIHGTFALATEKLVKHITDAAPSELYWDYIRRLILREKGLFTLHKLNEFCPHLEDLDVSDNDIGQVSGVPCSLRTLKIQRNCLTNLTAWGHLINLQYLDVSGNHLESLDGFGGLIHLRELKANDNKIRSIDGIFDLNGLLSLKLSNNSLAAADFESSDLVRLSELDLSHNQLTSVKNIKSLPSLEKLNLSSNQLTSIGCSETLRSLRSLKLSHNQFCALDVRMFPSLNLLYADRNSLSTILGLDHCRSLETLSAREQALADDGNCFDMDLGMMTDVRKIYLSSNRLSSRCLSPSVPLLSLQLFDVASCNIQSLPGDFALSFPNVKVLNLNFNSLTGIEEIAHMKCLSRLSAAGNRISRLRRLCQVLSRTGRSVKGAGCSMQKVDLRGNPLTVRFYPPPITGSGKEAISKLPAKPNPRKDLPDVLSTLDPLKSNIPLLETWDHSNSDRDEGDQTIDDKTPINDPYTLPAADPQVDEKYLSHLDESTRLRRRILELMLYVGSGGSIKYLDGLRLRPALEPGSDLELAWSRLEDLGVLKKRKDKKEIKDKKEKKDKKTKAIK